MSILRQIALTANEEHFKLFEVTPAETDETGIVSRVRIPVGEEGFEFFQVADLYIVNGELKHRGSFFSRPSLGNIAAAIITEPVSSAD